MQRFTRVFLGGFIVGLLIVGCRMLSNVSPQIQSTARIVQPLDSDWHFYKGDAAGAEQPQFDDSTWRRLDVPHDWSIEGPFDPNNPTGGAGGFLPAGIGWYRRHLILPNEYADKRIYVEFDGVMANSDVWINGLHLGHRPYGYVSFRYDLTGKVRLGPNQLNILAVRADNLLQPASRWYAGAGIYRHVRLIVTEPLHIDQWATFVTTPYVDPQLALVNVKTAILNQTKQDQDAAIDLQIIGPDGAIVQSGRSDARTIASGERAEYQIELKVTDPMLWDLERPNLYKAVVKVVSGGKVVDDEQVTFGICKAEFRAESGFWLNDKNVRIKGVCLHHDGGAFGAAVPLAVWERRLQRLREFGVNAIRTAHNPVAPEFLDLCDRMGLLVMDEFFDCWTIGKNPGDYHLYFNDWSKIDLRDTILRDRNHPCIIIYSVGNEIRDTTRPEMAKAILKGLIDVCHRYDPTRPVTQALFRPNVSKDYDNGLADMLDVIGTNYRDRELLAAWQARPTRKIIGTEQRHDLETWLAMRDNPQHAGQFLWTGVDYLGEAWRWPVVGAGSGLLDRTGRPRPIAYQRASWWSDRPVVYAVRRVAVERRMPDDPGFEPLARPQVLFADWTPADLGPHMETVEVYTNCAQVELQLNGRSLGIKQRDPNDAPLTWQVEFEPGQLKAIGLDSGRPPVVCQLQTAGRPARIVLAADRTELRPCWDDVCHVEAMVVDGNGVVVPSADHMIRFLVSGPGTIAAVDNGSLYSHEPFQATQRRAYQGYCMAYLKATGQTGRITLTATADGLQEASISLEAAPLR
ncbi:MAG: glycoside hydrolase family 2 TIM barrel-domain containing protein [Sedimentisphaerales bacterium]|nr:glycoside hydrolase family 2 TIM barrel-domain containing protein [Sedimentisphaerales bacterium]